MLQRVAGRVECLLRDLGEVALEPWRLQRHVEELRLAKVQDAPLRPQDAAHPAPLGLGPAVARHEGGRDVREMDDLQLLPLGQVVLALGEQFAAHRQRSGDAVLELFRLLGIDGCSRL